MTNEICLPTKQLSIDGTAPETGDQVEVSSLKGKVTRVEGDKTYFTPTEINGQPLEASDEPDGDEEASIEPNEESLRKEAGKMDEMMG